MQPISILTGFDFPNKNNNSVQKSVSMGTRQFYFLSQPPSPQRYILTFYGLESTEGETSKAKFS